MGNVLVNAFNPYDQPQYKNFDLKVICGKCGAPYKPTHGTYSERRSCRYHHIEDGECKYCHDKDGDLRGNCYHYKKKTCWDSLRF